MCRRPAVIKTVTGEEVTAERLGGAVTHNTESGAAHFTDSTDEEAIAHVRELLSYIPSNNAQNPPVYESSDDINRKVPEIAEIVPESMNRAYDMYDVIRAVADDGELFDVMKNRRFHRGRGGKSAEIFCGMSRYRRFG